ncbi:uncharacterized protein METZ01_LOCUS271869 [marine metagenome]|uniref:Uncharacterized protein n=1 Tax=marine metagenome TaxID=408172 RepID=A0A382K5B3_9ZZZZ
MLVSGHEFSGLDVVRVDQRLVFLRDDCFRQPLTQLLVVSSQDDLSS